MFKACEGMESLLLWVAAPRGVQHTQSIFTDCVQYFLFSITIFEVLVQKCPGPELHKGALNTGA